ncbi:MAG: DUF2085 domain-containing protein [Chloroflexi bacterium]|jgi:uncharacterized membrane protein|uniref:DUF2085 domain-containing protein n=1 Tax=Candidatus Thermofonsia Clade 3 bacterium TaxID=2364212 RepID=A0A2M8QEG4_9CHLR|nr:DUF2085 domain-containing protein [Candidatus Roseilinea sp. NK_OTU-006]PJF48142.1 MAG: hypothetical protein CUN48_05090 [Candidatus Thermofonsia Clade 3 bacterium]RMG62007.1 MAG: DUF2085 domain-containing protein [Chloroflexota bacterium]
MSERLPLRVLPLAVFAILALLAAVVPADGLRALDWVGNAVCHRIPARSFFVAGRQLPVCARDTGMFSAALLGVIGFAWTLRSRASAFPPRPYAYVFAASFVAWAFDGFNSYWLLVTGRTLFYQPQNWLRLTTGAFMGAALSAYVTALANQAIWRTADPTPVVHSWRDVLRLIAIAVVVVLVVLWRPDFLFGPIALTSGLGAFALLTLVNGLIALVAMRQHGRVERWRQLVLPGIIGFILTLAQIGLINLIRAALIQPFDAPF